MAWTDPPEDNPLPWIDGSKEMPAGNSVRGEKFSIDIKNRTDDIRDEDPPSFSTTGDTEIRDQGWMESPASQKVHGHDDELVSGDFLRNADRNTLLPETETPRPRNKEESDLKKTGDGEIALPTQGNREDGEFEKGRGHDRQRTSEDGDDDREPTTARGQDARLLTAGSGEERRQPATEGGGGDGRPTTEEDILQSTEDRHDGMLQTAEDKEEDRWLTAENKEEDRWLTAKDKEEDRRLTAENKEEDRWLTAKDKEEDRWLTAEDKEDIWLTAKDKEEDRSLTAGDEQNGRREALDADDVRDKAWSPLQPASELVKPSEAEPQRHLFSRPGDTTLADTFGGATTQTGFGKSAVEIECTMDAKGETPGGPSSFSDLLGDFDDIPTPTTTQRPTRGLAAEDSGEASDDLRLDDFLGVAEVEGNEPSRGVGRTHSTSSIGRRHKKLRKKKQASPVIVVDGVDEEEGPLKEGGGGDGGGEEEEEEDMEWRKKSGSLKEENKKEDGIDTEMDFAVLEVVSSHLNLEVSKQKTSLRKRGSLARRKRPTRNTVTLPAASDSIYMDSTVTSPAEPDFSDDDDLEKQTTAECSGDATETKKKFSPKKPPMIVPGLHDLTQSKLFKQERKKTAEEFPPATSLTGLSSADSRPWHSTGNLQESHLSTPTTCTAPPDTSPDPGSTPENGALPTPERKQQYKSPVWLSEMKAKTSSPGESGTAQNHASGEAGSLTSSSSTSAGEKSSQRTESFRREGLRTHGATPQVTVKKREQPEAEKPVWMRTAQEKTSRMAGQLQGHREGDENRAKIDDDDQRTAPPWEAELNKRKKLSLVVTGQTPPANNQKERDETPSKQPTASRERDVYTPSWMKSGGQLNITITPSSRNAGNVQTTNSSASDVRGTPGNPMVANEIPRWKTELAEKRRRQGEKASSSDKESVTSGRSPGGDSHSSTPADGSSPSSGSLPAWRQQLKPRRKPHSPDREPELEVETEKRSGEGGGGPDWVKQAEERRARLFKSGLLDQKANESHC